MDLLLLNTLRVAFLFEKKKRATFLGIILCAPLSLEEEFKGERKHDSSDVIIVIFFSLCICNLDQELNILYEYLLRKRRWIIMTFIVIILYSFMIFGSPLFLSFSPCCGFFMFVSKWWMYRVNSPHQTQDRFECLWGTGCPSYNPLIHISITTWAQISCVIRRYPDEISFDTMNLLVIVKWVVFNNKKILW